MNYLVIFFNTENSPKKFKNFPVKFICRRIISERNIDRSFVRHQSKASKIYRRQGKSGPRPPTGIMIHSAAAAAAEKLEKNRLLADSPWPDLQFRTDIIRIKLEFSFFFSPQFRGKRHAIRWRLFQVDADWLLSQGKKRKLNFKKFELNLS